MSASSATYHFRKSQRVASSPFPFISLHYNNNDKAPAEPHLDVREQGLYRGQAFRKDEGSVVETRWELLSRRVRRPLAALPARRRLLVGCLSVTALPAGVSGRRAAVCWAQRHFHGESSGTSHGGVRWKKQGFRNKLDQVIFFKFQFFFRRK